MGIIDLLGKAAGHIQEVVDKKNDSDFDYKVSDAEYRIENLPLHELVNIAKNYSLPSYERVAAKNILSKKYNYEI